MEPSILLLKEIAIAANEASSMDVAFREALDRICALAGWPVGHVYLPAEDGGRLEPTEIWYIEDEERFAEFRSITEATPFALGEGLPGRVLEQGGAVWIEDIPTVPNFARSEVANSVGLRGGFGFPILVGDEIAAVMEFFTVEPRPRDDELLETLTQAGVQLGRVVERVRASDELERRVADRTRELTALNKSLKVELVNHEQMESALRDSEAMYHSLVEYAPLSIYRKDLGGRVVFGNASYCEGLGLKIDELIGKTDFDLFSHEQASKYVADDERVIDIGEPLRLVEMHQGVDGTMYVEVLKTPIYDHRGECVGTQGIFWDVTAEYESRRKLEESAAALSQSNDDLAQFAYVASHDLQEPLRMVSSYLQLIERRYNDVLDETGREFMAFAVDGAKRMKNLIRALLEYSRIGTGGGEMELVSLAEVVKDVEGVLKMVIEESGAKLKVNELPEVTCDRIQIAQLLQNLIGNGLKFCRDRSPEIEISAQHDDVEHAWKLSVRDNGIGIEPEYLDRVFVIFQRLHSREDYAGTGIGLALCKRIVERHQGRIWVESEVGKGTVFSFSLPDV
ncbi:MAG: PAS domain S-box-containing protein [Verrucomicrobiales bacterium]|jgi:PAS domain S-box-containing protein